MARLSFKPDSSFCRVIPEEYHVYTTDLGVQACGDSLELLPLLPDESVDLIVTSPPFALRRKMRAKDSVNTVLF